MAVLIRSDLLLPFDGHAECYVLPLCAKINFMLIFSSNVAASPANTKTSIQGNLHYFRVSPNPASLMTPECVKEVKL